LLVDPDGDDAQLAVGIRHLRAAARLASLTDHVVWAPVVEYRQLAYRALILQTVRTALPPVWQAVDDDGVDLLALAADCGCVGAEARPCRHRDLCLAAAVWLDTPDAWAAGVPRDGRVSYFAELEAFAVAVEPWIAVERP
jgi:hypothetical protein